MINIYDLKYDQFADEHYHELAHQICKSRRYTIADFDQWFQQFDSCYNLKYVITAKPAKLVEIRNACRSNSYPAIIKYLVNLYVTKFSLRGTSIGNQGYNALVMTDRLGLRVCPLCNRNHIGNVDRGARGRKRTCQLDHFHNKETYPFLSMYFYNLIPSCPSCNHTKGTDDIDVSPYDERQDLDSLFRLGFNIQNVETIFEEQSLTVTLTEHPSVSRNVEVLGLRDLYASHNDTAFEILETFRVYSDLLQGDICTSFKDLFGSKEELRNRLFGAYLSEDGLKKQVLAKLKKDIYEDLEHYSQLARP